MQSSVLGLGWWFILYGWICSLIFKFFLSFLMVLFVGDLNGEVSLFEILGCYAWCRGFWSLTCDFFVRLGVNCICREIDRKGYDQFLNWKNLKKIGEEIERERELNLRSL